MKVSDLRNIIQAASSGAEVSFDLDGDYVECADVVLTETGGRQFLTFALRIPERKR